MANIVNAAEKPETSNAKASVVMVLAVEMQGDDVVITPVDVEHDDDDQTDLTEQEMEQKEAAEKCFEPNHKAMKKALAALHEIYAGRLYRMSFRSFENYCFVFNGMKRLSDEKRKRAELKYRRAKTESEGYERGDR